MLKKTIVSALLISLSTLGIAQKSKINAAWRGLTDYQATLKEKPDPSYLTKAKEAIDAAAANEETKNNPKLHIYRTQIYYELFKSNLKAEEEKAGATIGDKKARMEAAYSNVSTTEFKEAMKSFEFVKTNVKDQSAFQELLTTGLSMIDDLNNLAVGSYKAKKYDEASDYFESSFSLSSMVNQGRKDTVSLFNASLSAQKAKNYAKVVKINQRMVDEKMANAGTYQYLYNAKLNTQDTTGAFTTLQEGRKLYPNDMTLLNLETDYFLQRGKQQESVNNLLLALEKDPNNAVLHLIVANTFDNMANPKTKGPDGKDTDMEKPENFAELFGKAEEHYKKTVELKPGNPDYSFNALYNLGALYYNYGTYMYNKEMNNATITKLASKQKEIMAKCTEQYKKAIPYFEQALEFKPDDNSTLQSLRRLYLLVGNEAKAAEITTRLNKGK
jgi:tetratricopeptide (TPR) repeat protein